MCRVCLCRTCVYVCLHVRVCLFVCVPATATAPRPHVHTRTRAHAPQDQHINGTPCGCCWSFATVGVVECVHALATDKIVSLSEQQLIDCDHGRAWCGGRAPFVCARARA